MPLDVIARSARSFARNQGSVRPGEPGAAQVDEALDTVLDGSSHHPLGARAVHLLVGPALARILDRVIRELDGVDHDVDPARRLFERGRIPDVAPDVLDARHAPGTGRLGASSHGRGARHVAEAIHHAPADEAGPASHQNVHQHLLGYVARIPLSSAEGAGGGTYSLADPHPEAE